jgi:dihydrofolate reductase
MKLVVTTFLTLDGVMQAPGGPGEDDSGGFEHGGWLVPFADEDMGRIVDERFADVEAFLLGRKTYDIFAEHWPKATDPNDQVATKLNSLPKYVASRTLNEATWHNTTLLKGDVAAEVAQLKAQPGGELQVHGSGDLAQTLIAHGLIDEYRLWVYPVVLGTGKRLFREGSIPSSLRLTETQTTSTGVLVSTYEPTGEVQHGTFDIPEWEELREKSL